MTTINIISIVFITINLFGVWYNYKKGNYAFAILRAFAIGFGLYPTLLSLL